MKYSITSLKKIKQKKLLTISFDKENKQKDL